MVTWSMRPGRVCRHSLRLAWAWCRAHRLDTVGLLVLVGVTGLLRLLRARAGPPHMSCCVLALCRRGHREHPGFSLVVWSPFRAVHERVGMQSPWCWAFLFKQGPFRKRHVRVRARVWPGERLAGRSGVCVTRSVVSNSVRPRRL